MAAVKAHSGVEGPGYITKLQAAQLSWLQRGVFILALGLLPVYLFPSGGPQVVDGPLLILLAAHFLRRSKAEPALKRNVAPFLPFIGWAIIINLIYFLLNTSDYVPLFKSAELLYTFLIFLVFSHYFNIILEEKRINYIYIGFIFSIILIPLIPGYQGERAIRSVLSFNNPNQLGYYSLILASIAALLLKFKEYYHLDKPIYYWADVVILFFAHFLCLLSLSRGALLGLAFLDLWLLPRMTRKILLLFAPALIMVLLVVVWRPALVEERLQGRPGREITAETAQEEMEKRILHQFSIMKGMDYLVGRGGRSLTPHEGARDIKEVHNIFGEIFRCYGLIGLGFFIYWLLGMLWRSRVVSAGWYVWGALLIYNMTHYGLRFRSFWLLLAFLNAMIWLEKKRQEKNAPEHLRTGIYKKPEGPQVQPVS